MNTSSKPRRWPARRWAVFILLILTGQLALIFWLSRKPVIVTHAVAFAPRFYLPEGGHADWPGLADPTWFALASRRGFSMRAWLQPPAVKYEVPQWNEAPRPLELPVAKLGGELKEFARTNVPGAFKLTPPPEPAPAFVPLTGIPGGAASTLTIEGALAKRPLLSQLKLDAWPSADLLTNSVVLVSVDKQGGVTSAVLLSSCGSKDADAKALQLANAAQFKPLPEMNATAMTARDRVTWGRMNFHWQTVAPAGTNTVLP